MSLNLTGNGGKLSDFLSSIDTVSTPVGATEARQQELTRRWCFSSSQISKSIKQIELTSSRVYMLQGRSLDRGYMWAKQKFANDAPRDVQSMPKKKVDKKNIGEFADAWKVAQSTSKARKPEEVAELFAGQNRLPQDEAIAIIKKAEAVMRKEKSLLELKPPIVIVGDIHGQFFDLINMMSKAGMPGKGKQRTVYLFLGDYVDRGDFSCEVLLYLLSLKVHFCSVFFRLSNARISTMIKHKAEYPDSIYLLRGNHECRTVSSYFGFKEEGMFFLVLFGCRERLMLFCLSKKI